jgi:hypothetical protein
MEAQMPQPKASMMAKVALFPMIGSASLFVLLGCQVPTTTSQSVLTSQSGPGSGQSGSGSGQSGSSQNSSIIVTVSPSDASVQVGLTFQFSATVQGDPTHSGVTWTVQSDCAGGDCGTIDSTGKYFAPKTPHDVIGIYITATSVANPSKSGVGVIWVTHAPTGISVSPTVAWIPVNGTQQFLATGTPFFAVPVVNWSVSGAGCTGPSCGTIDAVGNYTAPSVIPDPPQVTVTATSIANAATMGYADVTIGGNMSSPDDSKLNGQYAFMLKGFDGDGTSALVGSFTADGHGIISSGIADYFFGFGWYRFTGIGLSGTYSVGPDNQASIAINPINTSYPQTFTLALGSFQRGVATRGRMIELDKEQVWAGGVLAKQDPNAFSAAAIAGDYAFSFEGVGLGGWPLQSAGRFTVTGGNISAGHADIYGVGLARDGSGSLTPETDVAFTGLYDVSPNGRGTAIFDDLPYANFSFYVVSANELFFIELSECPSTGICTGQSGSSGLALRQSGGPYSPSSLNGTSTFSRNGSAAGVGLDSFSDGRLSETIEQNNGGVITGPTSLNGTYTVDANGLGRGSMSLAGGSQAKSFYLVSPGKAFTVDLTSYESGMFEPQTTGPYSNSSIQGTYLFGSRPWLDFTNDPAEGILTADGTGNLTDVINEVAGTAKSDKGSYSVAPNGRTTVTLDTYDGSTSNWVFYPVSDSKAVGIEITPGATDNSVFIEK